MTETTRPLLMRVGHGQWRPTLRARMNLVPDKNNKVRSPSLPELASLVASLIISLPPDDRWRLISLIRAEREMFEARRLQ